MVKDTVLQGHVRSILPYCLFFFAAAGLYASSLYSYLLFHSLIEVSYVVVILTIFVLAWNARKVLDNHYILFLGTSLLSSAALELVHLFAFKNFGVFPGADANLPTQLWIAARYVFSLSFLIAPVYVSRRLNPPMALIVFGLITAFLFVAIFTGIFPDCYLEGQGLTPFKVNSEYAIIIILFTALGLLVRQRLQFDPRVFRMLAFSIISSAAAEAAFTRYLSVSGTANLLGHLFLFLSAFLIYRAIIVTGIEDPRALIFRNLERRERQLRLIAETSIDLIFQVDGSGKVVFCSPAINQYGYSVAEVLGTNFARYIIPEDLEEATTAFNRAIGGERLSAIGLRLVSADGGVFHIEVNIAPLIENDAVVGLQGISRDVTSRKYNEEALRESERFNEAVLDTVGSLVVVLDMEGRIQRFNQACERATGYAAAEVQGRIFWEFLIPEEEMQGVRLVWTKLQAGDFPNSHENHWIAQNGMLRLISWTNTAIVQDGRIVSVIGAGLDITERRVAEEAARMERQLFETVVTHLPAGINVIRGNDLRIQLVNPAYQAIAPGKEMVGKTLDELWPETNRSFLDLCHKVLASGEPHHAVDERNMIQRSPGGPVEPAYFTWSMFRVRLPGDEGWAILITTWETTERMLVEEKLRESEALYRGIGESIDYGVWTCAPDGRNTYASESFLKLVGMTQEQCSDYGWGDVLHPDDAERTLAAWRECVRTGGKWDIEHRFRGTDGRWYHVLARGLPIRNQQGEIISWAGINLDISRLKDAEQQIKASLAEKEVMLREIHHRVKNNLQIISSLVSLQADSLVDERIREELKDVRDRVRSMALVHEQLYQTSDLAQLDFGDYATSLLNSLWRSHGALVEKVRLHLEVGPVVLPIEAAVPCGLILNELAGNAIKHAFPGGRGGEVTVALEHNPEAGTLCLRVRDNGIGLPAELDWRQSSSLGLRLVQILANQLRGTVATGNGSGTEFRVTFSHHRVES